MVAVLFCCLALLCEGTTYYLHPLLGDDANSGTSPESPFQTLKRANKLRLQAGDHVLLAGGQNLNGQLSYEHLAGSATNPIVVSSYQVSDAPGDARAIIDAKGWAAGVLLKNCAHVEVGNLLITANAGGMKSGQTENLDMRCGVLITATQPGTFVGCTLTNLVVRDIFFEPPGFVRSPEEVKTANGTQNYGWGIRFMANSPAARMKDITITDCQIENVSHTGLKLTASSNGLQHVEVQRVQITRTGGPGVQMSGVRDGHFSQLDVNHSGSKDDSRKWGRGSGLWTWGSSDVVIEKSWFQNANGPGDSAGVHIDYNCRNVIVQYNLSANNAGGFCEILGNNYNCAYRYNVSINDGFRVKGKEGAFQEGKTFWLSGYTGDKSPRQGPFNTYFYNNTIYVRKDIAAKIAVSPTARGVLVANNIFYIEGLSQTVMGDQNRSDSRLSASIQDVVFKNNLFLRRDNWPVDMQLQDQHPILGDPGFAKVGGMCLEDYVPSNTSLVKHGGIEIPLIPNDRSGLVSGLKSEQDILGRRIVGNPDLGAIQTIEPGKQQLGGSR